MRGASITANNGVVDIRAMALSYQDDLWQERADGSRHYPSGVHNQHTRILGLSVNMDYQNWLIKSEFDRYDQTDRSIGLNGIYKYALLGVGYQYGPWLPMLTTSRYRTVADPVEGRDSTALSLRWDFRKDTTLKLQYDVSRDRSEYTFPFFGDARLLSVSLQGIF